MRDHRVGAGLSCPLRAKSGHYAVQQIHSGMYCRTFADNIRGAVEFR
jgi:hypothetical protein